MREKRACPGNRYSGLPGCPGRNGGHGWIEDDEKSRKRRDFFGNIDVPGGRFRDKCAASKPTHVATRYLLSFRRSCPSWREIPCRGLHVQDLGTTRRALKRTWVQPGARPSAQRLLRYLPECGGAAAGGVYTSRFANPRGSPGLRNHIAGAAPSGLPCACSIANAHWSP